jgi:hypothetical protein
VTGEHGVGVAKKKVLPGALGAEAIQVMRFLKNLWIPRVF